MHNLYIFIDCTAVDSYLRNQRFEPTSTNTTNNSSLFAYISYNHTSIELWVHNKSSVPVCVLQYSQNQTEIKTKTISKQSTRFGASLIQHTYAAYTWATPNYGYLSTHVVSSAKTVSNIHIRTHEIHYIGICFWLVVTNTSTPVVFITITLTSTTHRMHFVRQCDLRVTIYSSEGNLIVKSPLAVTVNKYTYIVTHEIIISHQVKYPLYYTLDFAFNFVWVVFIIRYFFFVEFLLLLIAVIARHFDKNRVCCCAKLMWMSKVPSPGIYTEYRKLEKNNNRNRRRSNNNNNKYRNAWHVCTLERIRFEWAECVCVFRRCSIRICQSWSEFNSIVIILLKVTLRVNVPIRERVH